MGSATLSTVAAIELPLVGYPFADYSLVGYPLADYSLVD